jgi:DNA-binding XRE family transcriptional regulator
MAVKAQLEDIEPGTDERGSARRRLLLPANGERASGATAGVVVHNASSSGLLLESPVALAEGEALALELPEAGMVVARVVWSSGDFYGCRFDRPIGTAALSAAELRSTVPPPVDESANRESLHSRLARLRHARRMSLADVADALELSKPTVWAWEKGRARPADHRLPAIAQLYGIELDELLGLTSSAGLDALLDSTRKEIATAFGTSPSKVRIMIDL